MKNDSLLKLSVVSAVTGILLLYIGAIHMKPGLTPISKIDKDFVGLETEMSGKIIDLYKHPGGHIFLKVKDNSGGVISVPIFSETRSKLDEEVSLLDRIQVKGTVKKYEGDLELIPSEAKQIKIIHTPPLEISKIDEDKLGEIVKIEGFVERERCLSDNKLSLEIRNREEKIKALVSDYVSNLDKFDNISKGSKVRIAGKIQPEKDKLLIKINRKEQLTVLEED